MINRGKFRAYDLRVRCASNFDLLVDTRSIGPELFLRKAAEQLWFTRRYFGLRCDLTRLAPKRPAKVALAMEPVNERSFDGFDLERTRARGSDAFEVALRRRLCRCGARTLHVACDGSGAAIYAQWLVRPEDQYLMHSCAPERFPYLSLDQVLVEGAYTFLAYRGKGAMTDGMAQLLHLAASEGFRTAITYVGTDNRPSLRGCAAVGFQLDHVRLNIRRLGTTRSSVRSVRDGDRQRWKIATARTPEPSS